MNFTQWRGHAAKQAVSKITYCFGQESILVELVTEDIKNILNVPKADFNVLSVDQHRYVWDKASQYSLDPKSNRLTIVRQAELFTDWSMLYTWIANSKINTKNYLLFVSHESEAPHSLVKGKVSYLEPIETIRNKGKLIKCSSPNDEDIAKFCMDYGLNAQVAKYLIEKSSGNLEAIMQVLKKVSVWSGSPSTKVIDILCDSYAEDSFADYLIQGDKKSAYLALQQHPTNVGKTIMQLNYRLDMLFDISRCLRKRMYDVDIATTTGIKIFSVKKFKHVAKDYTFDKVKKCRQILGVADAAYQQGATEGVLEMVISSW